MTIRLPKSGDTVDKEKVIYSHLEVVTLTWPVVQKHMGVKIFNQDGSRGLYITADARTLWQYLHGEPLPELRSEPLRETPTPEDIKDMFRALSVCAPQITTKPPVDAGKARPHEEEEGLAISSDELDNMLNNSSW